MAITAYNALAATISLPAAAMTWKFYDPADPGNQGVDATHPPSVVLYSETYRLDPSLPDPVADLTARLTHTAGLVAEGYTIMKSLNTNIPVGTIVPLA